MCVHGGCLEKFCRCIIMCYILRFTFHKHKHKRKGRNSVKDVEVPYMCCSFSTNAAVINAHVIFND